MDVRGLILCRGSKGFFHRSGAGSTAEFKNGGANLHPPYAFTALYLIHHSDNSTFAVIFSLCSAHLGLLDIMALVRALTTCQ
jgi:hypothetical protein